MNTEKIGITVALSFLMLAVGMIIVIFLGGPMYFAPISLGCSLTAMLSLAIMISMKAYKNER